MACKLCLNKAKEGEKKEVNSALWSCQIPPCERLLEAAGGGALRIHIHGELPGFLIVLIKYRVWFYLRSLQHWAGWPKLSSERKLSFGGALSERGKIGEWIWPEGRLATVPTISNHKISHRQTYLENMRQILQNQADPEGPQPLGRAILTSVCSLSPKGTGKRGQEWAPGKGCWVAAHVMNGTNRTGRRLLQESAYSKSRTWTAAFWVHEAHPHPSIFTPEREKVQ